MATDFSIDRIPPDDITVTRAMDDVLGVTSIVECELPSANTINADGDSHRQYFNGPVVVEYNV
jgi:hypothetical protein